MFLLVAGVLLSSVIAYITLRTRPPRHAYVESGVHKHNQSYVVPGTLTRRSHLSPNKFVESVNGIQTLYAAFLRGCEIGGNLPFLGTRTGVILYIRIYIYIFFATNLLLFC